MDYEYNGHPAFSQHQLDEQKLLPPRGASDLSCVGTWEPEKAKGSSLYHVPTACTKDLLTMALSTWRRGIVSCLYIERNSEIMKAQTFSRRTLLKRRATLSSLWGFALCRSASRSTKVA